MGKAFLGLIVFVGLTVGAIVLANPDLAKMSFNEHKANVEKMVDDLKKKAE